MSELRKTFIYCRACFYPQIADKCVELNQVGVMNTLNQIFQYFLPHFDIKVRNPSLCSICYTMFLLCHEFKINCAVTGQCLRSYLDANPQQDSVDLHDVLAHVNRDQTPPPPRVVSMNNAHDENGKTMCIGCNLQFASAMDLKQHRCAGYIDTSCFVCRKLFTDDAELKIHVEIQHEFACFLCRKLLISRRAYRKHNRMFHSSDLLEHKCDICEKYFTKRVSLKLHLRLTHKKRVPSKCPYCRKPCLKTYKKHIVSHRQSGTKKYICNTCKWVYFSPSGLLSHLNRDHKLVKETTRAASKMNKQVE